MLANEEVIRNPTPEEGDVRGIGTNRHPLQWNDLIPRIESLNLRTTEVAVVHLRVAEPRDRQLPDVRDADDSSGRLSDSIDRGQENRQKQDDDSDDDQQFDERESVAVWGP